MSGDEKGYCDNLFHYFDDTTEEELEKSVYALNLYLKNTKENIDYLKMAQDPEHFVHLINRKNYIDRELKRIGNTDGGVSLAVAMANLPTVSSEYNRNISASYGTYAGSHSFALGISGHIDNDRLSYKLSGAVNTKGNIAFGAGVGVNLGKKNQSNKELLDRIEKLENLVKQLQNK